MKKVRNKKQVAVEAYNWCCQKFGSPLKSGVFPELEIVSEKNSENIGYYSERLIVVNTARCKSVSGIIRTVIHEYTHFLQMPKIYDMSKYYKLSNSYKYENHPMEIEAFNAEKKYFRNCLRYLQRRKLVK